MSTSSKVPTDDCFRRPINRWLRLTTVIDMCFMYIVRRRYSISKRLVKLTRFQCYPLQVSGYQDKAPLLFLLHHQLYYFGWVFISATSVENYISIERLNTLYTDLQSILQNINKFAAGQTRPILTNTRSSH